MKKLIFLLCISSFFACKNKEIDIADTAWVLKTATINPAILVDGKAETDFIKRSGDGSCLQNQFSLHFEKNGTYNVTSTGPLCDMSPNTPDMKWTKDGNEIILNNFFSTAQLIATVKDTTLSYSSKISENGKEYTVVYLFESDLRK